MAELFGPLVGLLGTGLGMASAQEAAMVQLARLQFEKEQADKQFRLGTATRSDAYGNKTVYNPATNAWETVLTPTQKSIVGAGEQEQLRELTEDATRNRLIRQEARQRGYEAVPDYAKALAGFRYDEAPSRASDEDKLYSLLQLANEDKAGADKQAIGRVLLRQGRGADLPAVLKAANDASGINIGSNLVKAYQASIPQYASDVSMRQSRYLPILKQLQETMAGGGSNTPPRFSTTPQELAAIANNQSGQALQALEAGSREVGSAYGGLAKSIGDTAPDLKGLASIINAFKTKDKQNSYTLVPTTGSGDPGSGFIPNDYSSPGGGWDDGRYANQYNDYFGGF